MDVRDSLVDLERHRLRLEENLGRLRLALKHWQTWEAEYEGLREEILDAGVHASRADLVRLTVSQRHEGNGSGLILCSGNNRP